MAGETNGDRRWPLARLDGECTPHLVIAPFFLVFGVFGLHPLLHTAWVSLRDWQPIDGDQGLVGLDNYATLLGDANSWNTPILVVLVVAGINFSVTRRIASKG
ncbi:hypothetical protein [Umezawaea sp.]|uniref:hypothetical protein n=1 Tax=Umezawaea sp. TaxID=1955258 RepID=UPI002ED41E98